MKTIKGLISGDVSIMSVEELLPRLKTFMAERSRYDYNAHILNGDFGGGAVLESESGNEEEATYERRTTLLTKEKLEDKFAALIMQGTPAKFVFMKDPRELLEDVVVEHMCRFGENTTVVRLAPRTFLVLNPEDVSIIKGKGGLTSIANRRPASTFIVTVDRFLQSEFDARAKTLLASLNVNPNATEQT